MYLLVLHILVSVMCTIIILITDDAGYDDGDGDDDADGDDAVRQCGDDAGHDEHARHVGGVG